MSVPRIRARAITEPAEVVWRIIAEPRCRWNKEFTGRAAAGRHDHDIPPVWLQGSAGYKRQPFTVRRQTGWWFRPVRE